MDAHTTGQVARILNITEPQAADLVRRGKVEPPPIVAGRRLWSQHHLEQAATYLESKRERETAQAGEAP